jgi:hypothetical protein
MSAKNISVRESEFTTTSPERSGVAFCRHDGLIDFDEAWQSSVI